MAAASGESRGPQIPFVNVPMRCSCLKVVQGQQIAESEARALLRRADSQRCMLHEHVVMPPEEGEIRARKLDLEGRGRDEEGGQRETLVAERLATRVLSSPTTLPSREPPSVHPFAEEHSLLAPPAAPSRSQIHPSPSSHHIATPFRAVLIAIGVILSLLSLLLLTPYFLLPGILFIAAGILL